MRLKNKLVLVPGLLLTLSALSFYLLFVSFFAKDLQDRSNQVKLLLERQNHKELEEEALFLKKSIENEKEKIGALLPFLALLLPDDFSLKEGKKEAQTYSQCASFLAAHPEIGFVQLSEESDPAAITLFPDAATLYPVVTFAMNDHYVLLLLPNAEKKEDLFVAFPTPKKGEEPSTYLLFAWKEVALEIKEFFSLLEKRASPATVAFVTEKEKTQKLQLLQLLAPYYAEGLELFKGKEKKIPSGIAYLSSEGKGKALLSSEVFYKKSFFNSKSYYETEKSSLTSPEKISTFSPKPDAIYLVNTLLRSRHFLTIGSSLYPLLSDFSHTTQHTVLVTDEKGAIASSDIALDSGDKGALLKNLNSQKNAYRFPLKGITLYIFMPEAEENVIFSLFHLFDQKLKAKISQKLLLWLVVTLVIALILLIIFESHLSRPLQDLVFAIEAVKAGNYKQISFPFVGNRRDEIAILTNHFKAMVVGLEEKEKIRSLLNKVVSKDIAEEIMKSEIHLGGEERVVTMLFADIRGFTEMTQNFPPQKTVTMLNAVMTKMSKIIEGEGGVIDKYVGDEIMAIFNAPLPHPDHAIRALSTAKLMIETLRRWNKEREKEGEPVIEMGIGVHTGLVVVGNMGAEDRLNYTVVGASVNLASRLCQIAERLQLIISEYTLEEPHVRDSFYVEAMAPVSLKGFSNPVKIYQVTGFKWQEQ